MRAFYRPEQIAELRKKLGITLTSTEGLLPPEEFAERAGVSLSTLYKYSLNGTITPIGKAPSRKTAQIVSYYHPDQVQEYRKKLGITLTSTEGLLTQEEFAERTGVSSVTLWKHSTNGKIKPFGKAPSRKTVYIVSYYHPDQVQEYRKKLGITLTSTEGLLPPGEFAKRAGISSSVLYKHSLDGTIRPIGKAPSRQKAQIVSYYHPDQVQEYRKKLGITLTSTEGLLTPQEFAKRVGISSGTLYKHSLNGTIRPIGVAPSKEGRIGRYYRPDQILTYKRKLHITLTSVDGLLSVKQAASVIGCAPSAFSSMRERGLIRPHGTYGRQGNNPVGYYKPSDVLRLKRKLGITIDDPHGLLSEEDIAARLKLHVATIIAYRKRGDLKAAGFAWSKHKLVAPVFTEAALRSLKKKLGVTTEDTGGLLDIAAFAKKVGVTAASISKYVASGILRPRAYAVGKSKSRRRSFYHPSQAGHLKRRLGITLRSTRGLLERADFARYCNLSLNVIESSVRDGEIKPKGRAMGHNGVTEFFKKRDRELLYKNLGITLPRPRGLLPESEFSRMVGILVQRIKHCRKKGLISPIGFGMGRTGITAFYRPEQITDVKKALNIMDGCVVGLLSEEVFAKRVGFSQANVARLRRDGEFKPHKYFGRTGRGLRPFYHPKQVTILRKVVGITTNRLRGLLTEAELARRAKVGRRALSRLRLAFKITPRGFHGRHCRGDNRAYYRPSQVAEVHRALGITLLRIDGLLSQSKFARACTIGLNALIGLIAKGVVKPHGYAYGHNGLSPYYLPKQVQELRSRLGINLRSIRGLIPECEMERLIQVPRCTLGRFRKRRQLRPFGYFGFRPYYKLSQASEIRRTLGITIENTKGLLSERAFSKRFKITPAQIQRLRLTKTVVPVGYGYKKYGLSPLYRESQARDCMKALKVTIVDNGGLLTERQMENLLKVCRNVVGRLRRSGRLVPDGRGIHCYLYKNSQAANIKKLLGISQKANVLLGEETFAGMVGLSEQAVARRRRKGILKPIGIFATRQGVRNVRRPYYSRSQVVLLRKQLGFTPKPAGSLTEEMFARLCGVSTWTIKKARCNGRLRPSNICMKMTRSGFRPTAYYDPKKLAAFKVAFNVTLTSKEGLMTEPELADALGYHKASVAEHRAQGKIEPYGFYLNNGHRSLMYHEDQIPSIRKALGITLTSTKGLVPEKEFARICGISLTMLSKCRQIGRVVPAGYAHCSSGNGCTAYYNPKMAADLRVQLGLAIIAPREKRILLTEAQIASKVGYSQATINRCRRRGLIKAHLYNGRGGKGPRPFYHPTQAKQIKHILRSRIA